jgi:hypothetical protein
MSKLDIGAVRKIFCNTCKVETKHELNTIHKRHWDEYPLDKDEYSQPSYWEEYQFRLWVCRGCDTAVLEEAFTSIGMGGPNEQKWASSFYPKRAFRALPQKRFIRLDEKLSNIHREVIDSFNDGMPILCAIGLRALLEGICAEKEIEGRNLQQKIDNLDTILPANIVTSLHGFRFMGNLAAHELEASGENELKLAIEVIEDLLNFLYELDYKAQKLISRD